MRGSRQALRDQRQRSLAVPDGLAALAPHVVHQAEIPVGDNLDGHVRRRLADGQGAKFGLDRCRKVAGYSEHRPLEGQRAAEAALVADGPREGFGFRSPSRAARELRIRSARCPGTLGDLSFDSGSAAEVSRWPQRRQNLAAGWFEVPQLGQAVSRRPPHSSQNAASAGLSC
jgi:hypothetical protein